MPLARSKLEKQIVAEIRQAVQREYPGAYTVKIHGSSYQPAGLPDIHVVIPQLGGRAVWIEAKRPGLSPTKLQAATIERLRAAGAIAFVAHSAAEAIKALDEARRREYDRP